MKVKNINYKIMCDFYGCGKLAQFSIKSDGNAEDINICRSCAVKLNKELTKCLKGTENAEKK